MNAPESVTQSHVMNTYVRQAVTFARGDGVWMWDEQGNRYLDALAGIAVNSLGHAHPKLVAALTDQIGKLIHTSNLYGVRGQEVLASKICSLSGMDEVFFCNSGAEANEAAIKLARKYGYQHGNNFIKTIVMERSWHGRTITTLAATGSDKARIGFGPLQDECFVRVPYNDFAAVEAAAEAHPQINSILLEVLQGEGGVNVADVDYLRQLRRLCDDRKWLLILDEVQCGIGRTGRWFGFQHAGIMPDAITLAKGLGSGVPIGALATHGLARGVLEPGNHGTTFGGNPLAMRAGSCTLDVLAEERLLENATEMGEYLRAGFARTLQPFIGKSRGVREIRGLGLMIGIELTVPCGELVKQALAAGLLINVTRDTVIRLLPPLIINKHQADLLIDGLSPLVQQFLQQ